MALIQTYMYMYVYMIIHPGSGTVFPFAVRAYSITLPLIVSQIV